MSVKSGASALGSILLGGMSDRLGRLPSFALSALGQLVFVVYFCCFRVVPDGKRFALMFVLAALCLYVYWRPIAGRALFRDVATILAIVICFVAGIFTKDLNSVLDFADRIEAGVVKINGETAGLEPQVPFGGMKSSSSGDREQGKAAIEFFTQTKTIYVDRSAT